MCRALARDVIDYDLTPAGGSKMSRGTLTLPKRSRVIVGVDDTDTKEEGATWSLVNNIAAMVDNKTLRYVSHAIVQLYPVKAKTKNCVATVVEFASLNANKPIKKFQELLEDYTLSDQTGMAVLNSFGAKSLSSYSDAARSGEVSLSAAMEAADAAGVEVLLQGRGIIGAIAALPFFSQCDQSVKLDQFPAQRSCETQLQDVAHSCASPCPVALRDSIRPAQADKNRNWLESANCTDQPPDTTFSTRTVPGRTGASNGTGSLSTKIKTSSGFSLSSSNSCS